MTERNPKQLVAGLKRVLMAKKMPSYELARIIGCPDATLSRWINGAFLPSPAWQKLIENNKEVQRLINEGGKGISSH